MLRRRRGAWPVAMVVALASWSCSSGGADITPSNPARQARDPAASLEQFKIGRAHQDAGRAEDALVAFTAAIEADPENGLAYLHKAEAMFVLSRPIDEIQRTLATAVKILPDNPRAHLRYADALVSTDSAAAVRHYKRALELRPALIDARLGLAEHMERQGQTDAARAELEAAARLEPDNFQVRIRLANILEGQERPKEAAIHVSSAARSIGTSAALYRRAADLFTRSGDEKSAVRMTQLADQIDPPPKKRKLRKLRKARKPRKRKRKKTT